MMMMNDDDYDDDYDDDGDDGSLMMISFSI